MASFKGTQRVVRDEVVATNGVVSAAKWETANAGIEVLKDGGNAIDAGVAAGFVAATIEPHDTCICGSGMMLIHQAKAGKTWSVEFPPRAPQKAKPDMYTLSSNGEFEHKLGALLGIKGVENNANCEGYLASGIPGTIAGLCLAHEKFGRLPLKRILEPAIELAEKGFEVSNYYALAALGFLNEVRAFNEATQTFLINGLPPIPPYTGRGSSGEPPKIKQPELAESLRIVAKHGADGIYKNEIAKIIGKEFEENGGILTSEDLSNYKPILGPPLCVSYRGYKIFTPVSPCGGWTVMEILKVIEAFDISRLGHNSEETLKVLIEASRHAFADRYHYLGDPDFEKIPIHELLSDSYTKSKIAEQIVNKDSSRWWPKPEEGFPWQYFANKEIHKPWSGTTHFSVIDNEHNMVSCTHTAANAFGSKVIVKGTGLLFDSSMVWFNPEPGTPNSIASGKRPLVNMAPVIVTKNGKPYLGVGAPGGRRIISCIVQILCNVIDFGMSIQEAIEAPRIDASGLSVLVSSRINDNIINSLMQYYNIQLIEEEHEPFLYEFARPVGVMVDKYGGLRAGIDSNTTGYTVGY